MNVENVVRRHAGVISMLMLISTVIALVISVHDERINRLSRSHRSLNDRLIELSKQINVPSTPTVDDVIENAKPRRRTRPAVKVVQPVEDVIPDEN